MKIWGINNLVYRHNQDNIYTTQNLIQRLTLPKTQPDTVSFTGLSQNELIKAKKVLQNLVKKHDIPGIYSNKPMIPVDYITQLEERGTLGGKSRSVIPILQQFASYFDEPEKEVFGMLRRLSRKHPQKNLQELLLLKTKEEEVKLIAKQYVIFKDITSYIKENIIEQAKIDEFNNLLESAYDSIHHKKGAPRFNRKPFVGKMYEITKEMDKNQRNELIEIAEKLPASTNSVPAFVVKYSDTKKKTPASVGLNLLRPYQATIEHIWPESVGKEKSNVLSNFALARAKDNTARGNESLFVFALKHPEIIDNAQKQCDVLIKISNKNPKELSPFYILGYAKSLHTQSKGLIDLDTSKLNYHKKNQSSVNNCKSFNAIA